MTPYFQLVHMKNCLRFIRNLETLTQELMFTYSFRNKHKSETKNINKSKTLLI